MNSTRRIAILGASTAVAAGVMMIGGGPATAATPHTDRHHHIHGAAHHHGHGARHASHHHDAARPATDPWIKDQIAAFYPSAAQRSAVYDPWVKDQIALFENGTR
ncbi:hypothetical protein NX794_16145 [Streptomyces sp. LP11]|uniref:Uncharacterized protein n=1 Tax=Streptomyces pyxinicus TaxID=2970331 RepID=A0ABT2B2W8_9ACTN|nr:hypothetical protein [Streptomyces sp. LP11]MCS0602731.1 hypothetical protein [Streptomyces sp. LP11]